MTFESRYSIISKLNQFESEFAEPTNCDNLSKLRFLSKKLNSKYEADNKHLNDLLSESEESMKKYNENYIINENFENILKCLKEILSNSHKLDFIKNLILIVKIKSFFAVSGFYNNNLLLYTEFDHSDFKTKQFDILSEIIDKMHDYKNNLIIESNSPYTDENYKMSISEADDLVEKVNFKKLKFKEVNYLKNLIVIIKEWFKSINKKNEKIENNNIDASISKSIGIESFTDSKSGKDFKKFEYSFFQEYLHEILKLPLYVDEIKNLINIDNSIKFICEKTRENLEYSNLTLDECESLINQSRTISVITPEFLILPKLFDYVSEWKHTAQTVIDNTSNTKLYFKSKDITILEEIERIKEGMNKEKFIDNRKKPTHLHISKKNESFGKSNLDSTKMHSSTIDKDENTFTILSKKRKGFENKNKSKEDNCLLDSEIHSFESISRNSLSKIKHIRNLNNTKNVNNIGKDSQSKLSKLKTINVNYLPCFHKPFENIRMKTFLNLSDLEQLALIDSINPLKEKQNDSFCICREPDDEVNNMISCDECKQWFHGTCLKIPNNLLNDNFDFSCFFCHYKLKSKLKNKKQKNSNFDYIKNFFSNKITISKEFLEELIQEGENLSISKESLPELEILREMNNKAFKLESNFIKLWKELYSITTKELIRITELFEKKMIKNYIYSITSELESSIKNLYNESIGNCVENKIHTVIIFYMKQIEWFSEAEKIFSTKKFNEKNWSSICQSYESYFNFVYDSSNMHVLEKAVLKKMTEIGQIMLNYYHSNINFKNDNYKGSESINEFNFDKKENNRNSNCNDVLNNDRHDRQINEIFYEEREKIEFLKFLEEKIKILGTEELTIECKEEFLNRYMSLKTNLIRVLNYDFESSQAMSLINEEKKKLFIKDLENIKILIDKVNEFGIATNEMSYLREKVVEKYNRYI